MKSSTSILKTSLFVSIMIFGSNYNTNTKPLKVTSEYDCVPIVTSLATIQSVQYGW